MFLFFFFKQKTAYEMRISDWSSDVCSSDLLSGFDGIVERSLHLFGRLYDLDGHGADLDARLVAVEDCLHPALDLDGDFGTAFVQVAIHGLLADDLAHGGSRRLDFRILRSADRSVGNGWGVTGCFRWWR